MDFFDSLLSGEGYLRRGAFLRRVLFICFLGWVLSWRMPYLGLLLTLPLVWFTVKKRVRSIFLPPPHLTWKWAFWFTVALYVPVLNVAAFLYLLCKRSRIQGPFMVHPYPF